MAGPQSQGHQWPYADAGAGIGGGTLAASAVGGKLMIAMDILPDSPGCINAITSVGRQTPSIVGINTWSHGGP